MKIGIVLPNWIGDVCMATPMLRAVRKHFGQNAEIAGIMRPYVAKVLEGTNWLNRSFLVERRSTQADLRSRALLRRLHAWNPDMMVLLTNSLWSAAIAWMCGATTRVGYARNGRGPLLTERLTPPRDGRKLRPISAIDYYLRLAYAVGCPIESPQMELATTPDDEAAAEHAWRALGLNQARQVVAFNTGSAIGSARNWPQDRFVELARRIVRDPSRAVLVLCGPSERDTALNIERQADHPRVRSMAELNLSLGAAKASVRRSNLLVSTDSGPRHFAPAFDVPVVTLFGPIDPRWSESHHPKALNLVEPVDCRPCGEITCPLAYHRCMQELTVDRVSAAVESQLRRWVSPQAA